MSPRRKETLHIYRRVSTRGQEEKYSLDIQLNKGIEKSKSLKMNYKDWLEGGKSGSGELLSDRPVLKELFDKVIDGDVKHLFVVDNSRLSRNPLVGIKLRMDMEENGVHYYSDGQDINFSNIDQSVMFDMSSIFDWRSVKFSKDKSIEGKVEHFLIGGYRGGTYPMGYKSKKIDGVRRLVIVPNEGEYIRKIFEWYDNGKTIKQIGRILDKEGFSPRRSKVWNFQSIVNILKNELYVGVDTMKDSRKQSKREDGSYPILTYKNEDLRIVSDELFNRCSQKIYDILHLRNQLRRQKHEVLLRGKLWCDDCGSVWGVRIKPQKNERYYYCRTKENNWRELDPKKRKKCDIKKSINIPNTDGIVWDTLVKILSDSHRVKEIIKQGELEKRKELKKRDDSPKILRKLKSSKRTLLRKIKDLDERNEENREWYLIGKVSKSQYQKGERLVEKEKSRIWSEYRTIDLDIQNIKNKKLWIDWLSTHESWVKNIHKIDRVDERQEIVKEYVDRIMVSFNGDKNHHILKVGLKLPIVNDKYNVLGRNKRGITDYQILNGSSYFESEIKPVKVGRKSKKKVQNEEIGVEEISSTITEDIRLPPPDSNPSRSSRIGRGYYLTLKVDISSTQYWVRPLSENQNKLYHLISDLRNEGLTFPQISDHLNSNTDLKPTRSKREFYPPIVWSIWNKMRNREERLSKKTELRIYDIGLVKEE